uniref:Uncharacterized protein n=1 Tax=Ulva partita TaxID=1605170 RepID=A0A1C9ZWB5_9CHLO|nr:hypothetical protein [Ulva partita]
MHIGHFKTYYMLSVASFRCVIGHSAPLSVLWSGNDTKPLRGRHERPRAPPFSKRPASERNKGMKVPLRP